MLIVGNYDMACITMTSKLVLLWLYLLLCRRDKFQTAFANLGEVRSLLPESVNIMALTATAMIKICRELNMRNVSIIPVSSN